MDEIDDLRRRVEKLERQFEFLLRHSNLQYVDQPSRDASSEVMYLVQKGDLLGAIKQYRQETGADLKTAKNFVESLR